MPKNISVYLDESDKDLAKCRHAYVRIIKLTIYSNVLKLAIYHDESHKDLA